MEILNKENKNAFSHFQNFSKITVKNYEKYDTWKYKLIAKIIERWIYRAVKKIMQLVFHLQFLKGKVANDLGLLKYHILYLNNNNKKIILFYEISVIANFIFFYFKQKQLLNYWLQYLTHVRL